MYHKALHRFAVCTAFATFLLIIAGGLVTSHNAGLSVPDWPNTYGSFMFSFPLANMVGGIFYEHGHRMIASAVGFLTVVLALWLWRREERAWVRRLGYAAVGAVIAQGVLGGLTVLFYLPTAISVAHALLAQTFFCITLAIAYVTSREGIANAAPASDGGSPSLGRMSALAAGVVFVQLLVGAWMRHSEAGLAIPDFPLTYGDLFPPVTAAGLNDVNNIRFHLDLPPVSLGQIWVHFTHRLGAVAVSVVVIRLVMAIRSRFATVRELSLPASAAVVLLVSQLALGILTVLTGKNPVMATSHVAVGAALLGLMFVTTLRAYRFAPAPRSAPFMMTARGTTA